MSMRGATEGLRIRQVNFRWEDDLRRWVSDPSRLSCAFPVCDLITIIIYLIRTAVCAERHCRAKPNPLCHVTGTKGSSCWVRQVRGTDDGGGALMSSSMVDGGPARSCDGHASRRMG